MSQPLQTLHWRPMGGKAACGAPADSQACGPVSHKLARRGEHRRTAADYLRVLALLPSYTDVCEECRRLATARRTVPSVAQAIPHVKRVPAPVAPEIGREVYIPDLPRCFVRWWR